MAKLAVACKIYQITLSNDVDKINSPWKYNRSKVCYKLSEDVLKRLSIIPRTAANDLYTNYVHVYTDGSQNPNYWQHMDGVLC